MKILIDNGHGRNTPGKRSPDGRLLEYAYTREIAHTVVSGLMTAGLEACLVVKEDIDVPLAERCQRVNETCRKEGTDNVILVSIHCNAAGAGSWMQARGWECYTGKGQTRSDTLAEFLYRAAETNLCGMHMRKDPSDGDSDKEESFYILRHTLCPAVLTENLFQDNREDADYLLSPQGRQAVAQLHIDGIIGYLNSL
ncbi:N-acetylmuramoyl-L-alanine amidase [uncultured Bacteroides sp.]|uniref:N-acetylmuramoyl-L-alanine amidase n=1 Tax=uncultured Bacteroides sp. TaxID=162156 RepID=UPI002AA65841|nr:N-acetylmuramoyl-L-alanine amidase [uncultured Bacteroides sp.]